MSVLVTVRDPSITNDIKEYAVAKGERLRRFFNGITKLEIILGNDGLNKRAEIVLSISGADTIVTHADHEQVNAAIDLVIDRAEKRLLKHKEKILKHRGGQDTLSLPSEEPEEPLETYDEVIEKREFPT